MILHSIKRDDFRHPVRASYEAVVSLDVRIDMIVAYAEADETLGDYHLHAKLLRARMKKLSKKRNEVAHFMSVGRMNANSLELLIRPFFTWSEFLSNEGTELRAKQLRERAVNFTGLRTRICRHVQHVGRLRKLPPEHFVQEGDLVFPPLLPEELAASAAAPQLPTS